MNDRRQPVRPLLSRLYAYDRRESAGFKILDKSFEYCYTKHLFYSLNGNYSRKAFYIIYLCSQKTNYKTSYY